MAEFLLSWSCATPRRVTSELTRGGCGWERGRRSSRGAAHQASPRPAGATAGAAAEVCAGLGQGSRSAGSGTEASHCLSSLCPVHLKLPGPPGRRLESAQEAWTAPGSHWPRSATWWPPAAHWAHPGAQRLCGLGAGLQPQVTWVVFENSAPNAQDRAASQNPDPSVSRGL